METCSDVENVIEYYFRSLLERERERQSLQLDVEEQYNIMEQIAKDFVEFDIVAEEISFIRDLFIDIIHDKYKIYRNRYVAIEERPTEEEFATKLAGHALLNRISPRKNQIGFINDFIFGILIGDCILEDDLILEEMDGKYIDIACTAYASRSDEKKENLLKKVLHHIRSLNYEQQLDTEIKLANTIQRDYEGHYFSNRTFPDVFFDGKYAFRKCTFRNCIFKNCVFATSAFEECSFYDCKFYDIEVMCDTTLNRKLIFSANCIGHEKLMEEAAYEKENVIEDNYEQIVLKMYWGKGNRFSKGRLPEMFLLRTPNEETRRGIGEALESLKRKELLFKEGHYWFVNTEKIKEIKEILEIVKNYFHIEFDEESLSYYRFVTHLKYFGLRCFNHMKHNQIDSLNNDILEIMKEKYVDAYLCVLEIKKYVKQKYDYILEDEEILFLTIHVAKIILKK